ncbi:MAG TPA: META domain-containing protein [Steroidobacteraceae bacterium]|nr:META domain-containing protein [Steroidobacteraceae bacterium]
MNTIAVRHLHRLAIPALAPALLLCGCATDTYAPAGRSAPQLAGTRWTVTSIDGNDAGRGPDLTADFGVDGRVSGDSGCNHFSGPFIQDGSTLTFGELLSSRRDCAEPDRQRREDHMLDVLQGTTRVRLAHDGALRLTGPSGTMTLEQTAADSQPLAAAAHRLEYDCQGVRLSVEYSADNDVVRLTWPDGSDVLRRHSGGDVTDYQSAHSEWRLGHDTLWGREGAPPRFCTERP